MDDITVTKISFIMMLRERFAFDKIWIGKVALSQDLQCEKSTFPDVELLKSSAKKDSRCYIRSKHIGLIDLTVESNRWGFI